MEQLKMQCRKLSHFSYEMEASLPADQVQKAFDQSYRKIQTQLNLPGFRKGKVPVDYIRKNYKNEAIQEATQNLVETTYLNGLKENNLHPVGDPKFDFQSPVEGQPFHVKIQFDIHPQPTIKNFENLTVKVTPPVVSQEKVDQFIENLRDSSAQHIAESENQSCQKGHVVHIDISGQVEGGEKLPLQKDMAVEVGKQTVFKEIEEALLGLKVSESKQVSIQFPTDHVQFPNKKVQFNLQLKKIFKKEKPELNDQWAQKFQIETVEKMKQDIEKHLKEQAQQNYQNELREKILVELVKKNPFDVPLSIVETQKKHLVQDAQSKMKGASAEQIQTYIEKNQKYIDQKSLFDVKAGYVIKALAEKFNIQEDTHKIHQELQKQDLKKEIDSSLVQSIHWQRVQNRVLDTVIQKSKVK